MNKYFIESTQIEYLESVDSFGDLIKRHTFLIEDKNYDIIYFIQNESIFTDYLLSETEITSLNTLLQDLISSSKFNHFTINYLTMVQHNPSIENITHSYSGPFWADESAKLPFMVLALQITNNFSNQSLSKLTFNETDEFFESFAYCCLAISFEVKSDTQKKTEIAVSKGEDDWFWVMLACKSRLQFFRCDGFKGVLKFIEWILVNNI